MTALVFLSQAFRLELQVQSKLQQIADLRALASHVTAFTGNEPVSHTRDVTGLQNAVVKIIEEEQRVNEAIDSFVDVKRQVREVIDQVPDPLMRLILEKRYLLFESWDQIVSDLMYSRRWVMQLHRAALGVVEEILESREAGKRSFEDRKPGLFKPMICDRL